MEIVGNIGPGEKSQAGPHVQRLRRHTWERLSRGERDYVELEWKEGFQRPNTTITDLVSSRNTVLSSGWTQRMERKRRWEETNGGPSILLKAGYCRESKLNLCGSAERDGKNKRPNVL